MAQKSTRGFASMDAEKQRQIASKGGKAAHAKGTAHRFTPEEARAAGRKGGQAAHERGTAHEFTTEEARAAGRKGGQNSRSNLGANRAQTSAPQASPVAPQSMASAEDRENQDNAPSMPPGGQGT